MATLTVEAQRREKRGTGDARRLRREGMIPAVVYGHRLEPVALALPARSLRAILISEQGVNALVDLQVPGLEREAALAAIIRDVQYDPLKGRPQHVDFEWISLTEMITVRVPVHVVGEAPGVETGGVLGQMLHEVQIQCLPAAIPESLSIDISGMEMHDSRHVSDLQAPEGVELLDDPEEAVVTITPPSKMEIEEEPLEGEELEGEEAEEGREAEE